MNATTSNDSISRPTLFDVFASATGIIAAVKSVVRLAKAPINLILENR
jgi:hypothetical protein